MKAPLRRLPIAIALTGILIFALSGIALAAGTLSKTIDTANCTSAGNTGAQCATYGADGFTGTITFGNSAAGDTVTIADVICVNPVGVTGDDTTGGGFKTVGIDGGSATADVGFSATYTLTLDGVFIGTYTIPSGQDCSNGHYHIFTDTPGFAFTVPADLTADYSLTIDGVVDGNAAFGDKGDKFNSLLNKIYEVAGNPNGEVTANSPSVGPPENPPPVIPEAPLTVLLLATGGLTSVWYVSRKLRQSVTLTAA